MPSTTSSQEHGRRSNQDSDNYFRFHYSALHTVHCISNSCDNLVALHEEAAPTAAPISGATRRNATCKGEIEFIYGIPSERIIARNDVIAGDDE